MSNKFSYRRLYGANDNSMLSIGDVVTIAGQKGIRFVVMPDKLNRKQEKQWEAAIKKAEKLQLTKVVL